MNYDEINVDQVLEDVASAVEQGRTRNATKKETMAVRLAALSAIVRQMQVQLKNDKELIETDLTDEEHYREHPEDFVPLENIR